MPNTSKNKKKIKPIRKQLNNNTMPMFYCTCGRLAMSVRMIPFRAIVEFDYFNYCPKCGKGFDWDGVSRWQTIPRYKITKKGGGFNV